MQTDLPDSSVTTQRQTAKTPPPSTIPPIYRLIFLSIEPLSTLSGAIFAHYHQPTYLTLTHSSSAPAALLGVPISTSIVLSQLANLYLLQCINEALVLRCTSDLRVWKTFLFGLLVGDLGHLYTVRLVGGWVYWRFWCWNSIDWGNVGFVYFLIVARLCFFAGLGFGNLHSSNASSKIKTKGN